ncbi:amidohydrolase family protein [Ruania alkalisoli]|uniref:Amidohydrolase family protein n=1 Tax=Ruania alkalisoli TaxID=2779775 RepID=A0A7M1SWX4_9MICO|nr:amidohydrolase family protein [Ruania alkalisoli]QOR71242.1 amidohydrolase family protein [Ruania alkalisoli]
MTGPATGPVSLGAPDAWADLTGTVVTSLCGVRLLDGTIADLTLAGGTITAVTRAGAGPEATTGRGAATAASGTRDAPGAPGAPGALGALGAVESTGVLDATGWRFVPAASEPHAHLDKALTANRIPPGTGHDLVGAIDAWRSITPTIDAGDITTRARATVGRYLARGITTVRTHVDVHMTGDPLRGVDALVALREQLRGTLTLQVCLLAGEHAPDAVVAEAVDHGIDVIGGCPHLASDPRHETTRMLDLAERTGLPVDLHTDEQTTLDERSGVPDIADLAQQVLARGLIQRVTASHCVRLGSLPPADLAPVLDVVARAGLGIVTLPITNLYLQGWHDTRLIPRGIAPLRAILDAGIDLAAGADNLRDPFNPVGRADPFETTSLLVSAGHLRPEEALAAVTTSARTVLGLPPVGATPGAAADFLLVPDADLGEVIAGGTTARVVVSGGRVVADTRVRSSLDHPALDPTESRPRGATATAPTTTPSSTPTRRPTPIGR